MVWKLIKRNLLYPLTVFLTVSFWLLSTESGLKVSLLALKPLLGGQILASQIQGKWIDQIKIQGLKFESTAFSINIEELTIKPQIFELLNKNINISFFSLKNSSFAIKSSSSVPIIITESHGRLKLKTNGHKIFAQIDNIEGSLLGSPFVGLGELKMIDNNIESCNVSLDFNKHQFRITQSNTHSNKLDWDLKTNQPNNMSVDLQGSLIAQSLNHWVGEIIKANINSRFIGNWNLKNPCLFSLTSDYISLGTLQLQQSVESLITVSAYWDKKVGLTAELNIPTLNLQHPNLKGKFSFHFTINQKAQQTPLIKGQFIAYPGAIIFPLSDKQQVQYSYLGANANFLLNDKGLTTEFVFKENKQNFTQGHLKTITSTTTPPNTTWSWGEKNIEGNVTSEWSDLSLLYSLIPEISKPKGSLSVSQKITGTLKKPLVYLQANIKKVAFFIPKQGVQIKNLNCQLVGTQEKLTIEGSGFSGNGQFTLKGISYPDNAFKTTLELVGENLQIYNTTNIQIIASPNIALNYTNHTFFLTGTVQIPEAYIFVQDNKNRMVPSKDVVLVDSKNEEASHPFKIIPSLYLKIENHLHFKGYGLDGIIGGKLAIEERPDGLLAGSGRLTIKEGKYRLQGATRYIHHGHLLFPPGTLLNDPILDIRISQKRVGEQQEGTDVGIYVQGTLQNPLPHLYSSSELQNADILSRLGFGSSEITGTENQRQVLTQTAFLLSGNANPFIDLLQTNLGLEEFSLESRETNKISTQGGTDTVFVLGKSLSKKLYLQCLQNVMEPVTTVKLKYSLSPYFSTSVETGTEGLGGDITFSMEKD